MVLYFFIGITSLLLTISNYSLGAPIDDFNTTNLYTNQRNLTVNKHSFNGHNSISSINLDQSGQLWITSYSGLIKFNGTSYKIIDSQSFNGFVDNRFIKVLQNSNGNLFVLSEYLNVYEFNPKTGTVTRLMINDQPLICYDINLSNKGFIWLATETGIYFKNESNKLEQYLPGVINSSILKIKEDQWNGIWFLTDKSELKRSYKGQIKTVARNPDITSQYFAFNEIKGVLWVGWLDNLVICSNQSINVYKFLNKNFNDRIQQISYNNIKDELIIGTTYSGFYTSDPFDPQTFKKLPIKGEVIFRNKNSINTYDDWLITSSHIYDSNYNIVFHDPNLGRFTDYQKDKSGNYWVTSDGIGLLHIKKSLFDIVSVSPIGPKNNISTLLALDSEFLIGTYGNGLFKKTGKRIVELKLPSPSQARFITSLYQSSDKHIWIGSFSGIIYEYQNPNSINKYQLPLNNPQAVRAIYEDQNKTLWFASSSSLFKKSVNQTVDESEIIELGKNVIVNDIKQAPDGLLWFSSSKKGSFYFKGDDLNDAFELDRSSSISGRSLTIEQISEKKYRVWIPTEINGIYLLEVENSEIIKRTKISTNEPTFKQTLHKVLISENNYWISSNSGLIQIDKTHFNTIFRSGKTVDWNLLNYSYFNNYDGFKNSEFNGGYSNSAVKLKTELLAFANQRGVVVFNPKSFATLKSTSISRLENLKANGTEVLSNELNEFILNTNDRYIELNFSKFDYSNPKFNRIAYRLLPIQKDWRISFQNEPVYFSNLSANDFILEVKSIHSDTVESRYSIIIPMAWYENPFLWILIISTSILIGFSINRVRNKKQSIQESNLVTDAMPMDIQSTTIASIIELSKALKNPISLIQIPLKQLINQSPSKLDRSEKKMLSQAIDQTNYLVSQIDKIISVDKNPLNEKKFIYSEVDINSIIGIAIEHLKQEELSYRNKLIFKEHNSPLIIRTDSVQFTRTLEQFYKAIIESVTHENAIYVSIGIKGNDVEIKHIFEDLNQDIFDHFNSNKSNKKSSLYKSIISFKELDFIVQSDTSNNRFELVISKTILRSEIFYKNEHIYNELTSIKNDINQIESSTNIVQDEKAPLILCVDDFKPFRILITEALKHDYKVISAATPSKALSLLSMYKPDLFIIDYKMPEMNGLELIEEIKKIKVFQLIPIILMSAIADELEQIEGLEKGADIFISKPFQPATLLAQVNSLISLRNRYSSPNDTQIDYNTSENLDKNFNTKLIEVINENYRNPKFNVEMLSESMDMDRTVLFRKIKKLMDKTPSQLIQESRINASKKLLIEHNGNVSDVAYLCGYNSLSYFSQAFKSHTGQSPSEWLQKYNTNEL